MVSDSPEARQEGTAAGINCFLHKTEIMARLVSAVRSLLSAASVRRRRAAEPLVAVHR